MFSVLATMFHDVSQSGCHHTTVFALMPEFRHYWNCDCETQTVDIDLLEEARPHHRLADSRFVNCTSFLGAGTL
ncbi:hypothetical protein BDZ91DRAFT_732846 [Kalaharituber pfeilii]|nr:hypothetical protein BDZ91DRAFT_732846 [Kalaharituber pfeilii]